MDSTIELGRGDVYVKSWSKQSNDTHFLRLAEALDWPWFRSRTSTFAFAVAAICSGSSWRCLGSLRERSFCTHGISNPDECDLQKKEGEPNDWLSDWYLLPLWCSQAGDKNWLGSRCVTPRKCLQLICFPPFRVLTLIAFYVSLHWLREKMHVGIIAPMK